ncbi:hypothetical protein M3Y99_01996500 [Aphelenchoides fujianensis]|nr:hypothetical protein M3Y99_01996500 [Aphelenchoides fujianensis]
MFASKCMIALLVVLVAAFSFESASAQYYGNYGSYGSGCGYSSYYPSSYGSYGYNSYSPYSSYGYYGKREAGFEAAAEAPKAQFRRFARPDGANKQ